MLVLEYKAMGVYPAQIYYQFKNLTQEQLKWNKLCGVCERVAMDEQIEVIVTEMRIPIISNRLFIDAIYLKEYPERDEYMAVISN